MPSLLSGGSHRLEEQNDPHDGSLLRARRGSRYVSLLNWISFPSPRPKKIKTDFQKWLKKKNKKLDVDTYRLVLYLRHRMKAKTATRAPEKHAREKSSQAAF